MATGFEGKDDRFRNMQLHVRGFGSDIGTATASAGAATVNDLVGLVTTEDLTTAQNAVYTLTITNDKISASDLVFVTLGNGTNTQGTPTVTRITPGASSVVIKVSNLHASAEALNGTLKIGFMVVKAL